MDVHAKTRKGEKEMTRDFNKPTPFMDGSRKAGIKMIQQISVTGKIVGLTNIKEAILQREYDNFNNICQQVQDCRNNDIEPQYSWFKNKDTYCQQVTSAVRIIKEQFINRKEQPLYLRNDVSRIEKKDTKFAKYWLKIPTKQRRQFWVAVKFAKEKEKLLSYKFCDSKIVRRESGWFAHITIEKEIAIRTDYKDILGIDLGIRRIASVVRLSNGVTKFYGRELRETRGHYFHLRKSLGMKKANRTIKKIGNTEHRKVNDQLHKISREIVNQAIRTNSLIVLGDLKGITYNKERGRKFNRKLSSMPFAKLSEYITYKANWAGIRVIIVTEEYTSQTCHKCKEIGTRTNGLFKCKCGYQDNSDRNGAFNIAERGLGQCSSLGASVIMPRTVGGTYGK
jgi:putative transposase